MIVYTIIQILLTLAGAGVIGYSIYLTIQVSGDKLLTLDSELGYRYATSYHRWQLYAGIAIVSLLILWIVYILIVRAYRVKHREERLAKKAEKKNEKKIAREQKKQKKTTSEYIQPVNAQNMQQPYAQGYYPNGYNADEQGYASNAYDVNTQIYDQMANSQDISTDKADSQEMKQEWNGKE